MKVEFTTATIVFLCIAAIVGAFAIVMDWLHNREPLESAGDEFAGWDLVDEDFNQN